MRVALLQYTIYWADKKRNLQAAVEHIQALQGKADIALLPEMFTTGFVTSQPELAEPVDGTTITTLQRVADETRIAIVGSFICCDQSHLYNRGFFLRPSAEGGPSGAAGLSAQRSFSAAVFVDKSHLYAHGGEDRFFVAGRERTIINYMGVRFRLAICYDLRFPVWLRQDKDNLYDILLVTANWPECRIAYWDHLVPARAFENQCYIAAVNPVGEDDKGLHYNGHSVAYGSHPEPLVTFADDEQATKIVTFDIDALHHFRQVLPLYQDADTYELED